MSGLSEGVGKYEELLYIPNQARALWEAFQNKKRGNLALGPKWRCPPPPLYLDPVQSFLTFQFVKIP